MKTNSNSNTRKDDVPLLLIGVCTCISSHVGVPLTAARSGLHPGGGNEELN